MPSRNGDLWYCHSRMLRLETGFLKDVDVVRVAAETGIDHAQVQEFQWGLLLAAIVSMPGEAKSVAVRLHRTVKPPAPCNPSTVRCLAARIVYEVAPLSGYAGAMAGAMRRGRAVRAAQQVAGRIPWPEGYLLLEVSEVPLS